MSKLLRVALASGALLSTLYVQAPAQAQPPVCLVFAFAHCTRYEQGTEEWGACVDMMEAACEAARPGPLPHPWPGDE